MTETLFYILLMSALIVAVGKIVQVISFNHKKKKKDSLFKIIYFPLSGKHYPNYRGMWLQKFGPTGIVKTTDLLDVADGFETEKEARFIIKLYKEQKLMKNITIIDY